MVYEIQMKKSECTPEQWERYKADHRARYNALPADRRARVIARTQAYASRHPEYRWNFELRRKYGITVADYQRMLEEQDHRCALCRKHEDEVWVKRPFGKERRNGRLVVDHCHETGQVRGLLCDECNVFLGKVEDKIPLLWRMIDYLAKSKPLKAVG